MELTGLKLISIILVVAAICALSGYLITRTFFNKGSISIPMFVYTRISPDQFFGDFYDEAKSEFRIASSFPGTASATYYGLSVLKKGLRTGFGDRIFLSDEEMGKVLKALRSYYDAAGYYVEEGVDPVFLTSRIMQTTNFYPQKLNQAISLKWLDDNSLLNKSLPESKFDPEYQYNILEIYRNIDSATSKLKMQEIDSDYINYYSYYDAGVVSDSEYLRKKYYQVAIISYLTNIEVLGPTTGLKADEINSDIARLKNIALSDVSDIKDFYWLYSLKKFYQITIDPNVVIATLEKFYLNREFKEKAGDNYGSLIGMYYASQIYRDVLGYPL